MIEINGKFRAVAVPVTTEDGRTVYAQIGSSKEKQTPQVVINFQILDGEYTGVTLAWIGFFSATVGKSGVSVAQRTIESLRVCGFKGDDLDALEDQTLDQEVQITVEMDEYQGKRRPKVLWVNRPGGGGLVIPAMESQARRRLSAEMKNLLKATPNIDAPKAAPVPASNGRAPSTGSAADPDDIPF